MYATADAMGLPLEGLPGVQSKRRGVVSAIVQATGIDPSGAGPPVPPCLLAWDSPLIQAALYRTSTTSDAPWRPVLSRRCKASTGRGVLNADLQPLRNRSRDERGVCDCDRGTWPASALRVLAEEDLESR